MTLFVPAYAPSYGTPVNKKYRTESNEFGDGYEAITPDGLNNIVESWNVVWENISNANADDIDDQLDTFMGTPFEWVTPKGLTKRFTCAETNRTYAGFDSCNFSATFVQNFSS